MKVKRKVGGIWVGEEYIHGPRLKSPKLFSKFRLGKPMDGVRLVFGKSKRTGKWEVQSKLKPRGDR